MIPTDLEILENLEKSGNLKMVSENMDISGDFEYGQGFFDFEFLYFFYP